MSIRINIILPEGTVSVLNRVAARGGRSRFIDRAVHYYVQAQVKESLRKQLEAGYRANAQLDLEMAAEWFTLEEEAWETSEAAAKPKKMTKTKKV